MANLWQWVRSRHPLVWLFTAAVGLGLLAPLWFLLPLRSASRPPASREAHQAIVTEVIAATDRATLIGASPTKGNPRARVVLFKFSDFQCPYCAVTAAQMKPFVDQHQQDLLFVYKHFPLTQIHPEALASAKAAWAAGQQGQFWLYHDGLFVNQNRLGEALYLELAEAMGLNLEQFNRDRTSPEAEAAIQKDLALAQKLQLQGTPSFIMNDLLIPGGAPMALFEEIFTQINQALNSQE
ncbi:MAG TPA: thioredoxin domain-containing protein [Leptolyngbyaceae cyanobacterium M65_K2018_010]|nr:thioredoxin domain-containing protein [Leptolyngbyaceae cyanobacterium M65_K2018_010]